MAKLTLSDVTNQQNTHTFNNTINSNSVLIETALENTLSRDGTTPNYMTADLDMNSNRILNLPDATTAQEPVTYSQIQDLVIGDTSDFIGTPLTKTDDSNVTLTLGGSHSIALLNPSSITAGWTGQLALDRGGTGQATASAGFDALAPTTTRGDLIFRNATTNARLAAGTSGYALMAAGAGADPAWTGFLQAGTGAVIRTWQTKTRELVSVKDFGALGDGTTNDTTAFQAAVAALIAAGGGELYVPRGVYPIDGLEFTASITLVGEGKQLSVLKARSLTGDLIFANYSYCVIKNIGFTAASSRTSGCYINSVGNFNVFEELYFEKHYCAIQINGGVQQVIQNCTMYDATPAATSAGSHSIGIGITGATVATVLNNIVADAPSGMPTYGILMQNCDATVMNNLDIIRQGWCLAMLPGNGQGVHATYVTNSFFDSATRGVIMLPSGTGVITRPSFSNVWCNSHTADGFYVFTTTGGCLLNGVQASLNTGKGVVIGTGNQNVVLNGSLIVGNTSDGISVASGVNYFTISNCVIGGQSGANGGYGIVLSGSNDNFIIANNDLRANTSGAVYGAATSTTQIINDNLGFRTKGGGVAVPTLDAGGNGLIPHALVLQPNAVSVTPVVGVPLGFVSITSVDATNIGVRLVDAAGAVITGARAFYWSAY